MVGNKLPLSVLVTEYAQADPTFVVKTTVCSATTPSVPYAANRNRHLRRPTRPIVPSKATDSAAGEVGGHAFSTPNLIQLTPLGVVFSYFEILLQSGDLGLVMQEMTRLQSFEQNMRIVGIDYDIIVDMFDYTWELFEDIRQAVERKDKDEAVLLRSLNDENKSNSIVYHFKVCWNTTALTAAPVLRGRDDDQCLHATASSSIRSLHSRHDGPRVLSTKN